MVYYKLGVKPLSLAVISIPPASGVPPKRLLVLLHGWGANSQDVVSFAPILKLPEYQFLFPDAPFPHHQAPGGRAWYALERQGFDGIIESRQLLRDWLISLEAQTGVSLNNTIMAGFSQGGAMTLDIGSTLPLAGLCSLSGYLHSEPQAQAHDLPPTLIVHGRQDSIVPIQAAKKARDQFTALGATVEYHEFDMGHEIPIVVISLMQKFIQSLV